MINLKRCNYITGDRSGLSAIIDFLELDDINSIFISHGYSRQAMSSKGQNRIIKIFQNIDEFVDIIKNDIFRVNLLVFWFDGMGVEMIRHLTKIIDDLNIDYIIFLDDIRKVTVGKTNTHYSISKISSVDTSNPYMFVLKKPEYRIEDMSTGESCTIEDFKLSYIRDKKIDNIFKKD